MSKKLIAVASAAALALTALVAVPAANAADRTWTVVDNGAGSQSGTSADFAIEVKIPTSDVLRYNATVGTTTTVVRFLVTPVGTTDVVRATAQTGLKILTADQWAALDTEAKKNTSVGATTAEVSAVEGADIEFYVFSTSTDAKSITFSSGTNSTTQWVKGISPAPYNVTLVSAPRTLGTNIDGDFDFKVTDAFGNVLETANIAATIQKVGPVSLSNPATLTYSTDRKVHYFTATGTAKGNASIQMELDGVTPITAFGTPSVYFTTVTVGGTLEELVEGLEAQVAALEAKVAAKVTKKRFNRLARKWNAAFPNDKVKLKK